MLNEGNPVGSNKPEVQRIGHMNLFKRLLLKKSNAYSAVNKPDEIFEAEALEFSPCSNYVLVYRRTNKHEGYHWIVVNEHEVIKQIHTITPNPCVLKLEEPR